MRAELRRPYEPFAEALGGSRPDQAERLGVDPRQVTRGRRYGLTDGLADRSAIQAGLHPAIVWTDWHEAVLHDAPEHSSSRWHDPEPDRQPELARQSSMSA